MLVGNDLLSEFHRLCRSAERRFWVVSPFLGSWSGLEAIIGSDLLDKIHDIRLITDIKNTTGIDPATIRKFLDSGEVKTLDMLHAKLYVIDDTLLITSANLSKTAFCKRYEIGNIVPLDENIEAIFNSWWDIAEIVKAEDIKDKDYKYNPGCETGGAYPSAPILWKLSSAKINREKNNGKITLEMAQHAYRIAKDYLNKHITITKGREILSESGGWNQRSANIYIWNLAKMLKGKRYTQTMSEISTEYYLDNIYNDFGKELLQKAIESYIGHVKYYRNCDGKKNTLSYAEDLIARVKSRYGLK